jgi:predicted esterase
MCLNKHSDCIKNFFLKSIISFLSTVIFVASSSAEDITIEIKETSNLPIHVYESRESVANIIAIIGGKGLKNKNGKSRNFLVQQKKVFIDGLMNFYLLPNYTKKEKASYEIRVSDERMKRVLALVKEIKERNGKPVFIVGFSRGSVDAGQFAKKYPDQISGIVLASGIYTNNSRKAEFYSMQMIIGDTVETPTLLVHHSDDSCIATPFEYAEEFYTNLNAPSKMFLSYSKGLSNGGECGPLNHHGFEGIGENVASNITSWIRDTVK